MDKIPCTGNDTTGNQYRVELLVKFDSARMRQKFQNYLKKKKVQNFQTIQNFKKSIMGSLVHMKPLLTERMIVLTTYDFLAL